MMFCSSQTAFPICRTVTIPYSGLKEKNVDLSAKIGEGFGPNGLGILSVTDVPDFSSLRQNLLHLSPALPEENKGLEDPHSRYCFGWSHGKEIIESGKPVSWSDYLTSKSICCDSILDGDSLSSWCGWHTDYGSLTGLTCAVFKRDGVDIPCPDSAPDLYIKTRTDEIAYQLGETAEILTRGYLCATPHGVQAPKGDEASGVDRSPFALFMQTDCYFIQKKMSQINAF